MLRNACIYRLYKRDNFVFNRFTKNKFHMANESKEYNFKEIESYWQSFWEKQKTFRADDFGDKPGLYVLDMLPYPSGEGLHIGHPEGYTATDILGRKRKAEGYNVLHPMGWDAFGLPAEQHAIKTGIPPADNTKSNIDNFRRQLKRFGFGFDWDREVDTTDPNFYKWTQWIFLQLFKSGLAYVDEKPVWWCPELGTALANEEVIDGRSERGNYPVERRNLRQWVLRITAYAEKLLEGLSTLDWPDSTKRMQEAWIGRSEGVELHLGIQGLEDAELIIFTTRIDTLYGTTFVAIAPEHPLVDRLVKDGFSKVVEEYIQAARSKSDLKRQELTKDKTGVFTGSYAINPINGEAIPIWVADYVLLGYGTGVVIGVPGHDERDHTFAIKYQLPIRIVVEEEKSEKGHSEKPHFGHGHIINSGEFNGLTTEEALTAIAVKIEKMGKGRRVVNYKLRDWLFSRQRYWGEPFPIIWVEKVAYEKLFELKKSPLHEFLPKEPVFYTKDDVHYYAVPLPLKALPLELPAVESYKPSGSIEGPLGNAKEWLEIFVNLEDGETVSAHKGKKPEGPHWVRGYRETNTMPQWAGSCWYYLRYIDPHNSETFLDKEKERYWKMPAIYVGGAEHAVLHLLYARFWHRVLYDLGYLSTPEPFLKLVHQGLILGEPEHSVYKDMKGAYISAERVDKEGKDKVTGEVLQVEKLNESDVERKDDNFVLKKQPDIVVDSRSYKMSKSRGNVVSVDKMLDGYGADAVRLYEMFLGPLEAMKPWSSSGIEGIVRFLKRIWREVIDREGQLVEKFYDGEERDEKTLKLLHETIRKVSDDIEKLQLNTAISQLMILLNHLQETEKVSKETIRIYIQLLAPFAPHIAEELWQRCGCTPSVSEAPWPKFDPAKLVETTQKIIIQVNGKMRGEVTLPINCEQKEVIQIAKADPKVQSFLEGKRIVKEIYVPGKILNLVIQ